MLVLWDQTHLAKIISNIKTTPPDLVLISACGSMMKTWRMLVSLFSKNLTDLVHTHGECSTSLIISCPVNKNSLETLLDMLHNFDENQDIIVNEAFHVLGIDVEEVWDKAVGANLDADLPSKDTPSKKPSVEHKELDICINTKEEDNLPNSEKFVKHENEGKSYENESTSETAKPHPVKTEEEDKKLFTNKCEKCDSKHDFKDKFHLQKHLAKNHDYDIVCPVCTQTFHPYDQFLAHRPICKLNISCNLCTEKFNKVSELKLHNSISHIEETLEDKHCCHICGDEFKKKSAMKYHIKAKHEAVKLPCPYCGECFQEMETHVKNIHENSMQKCSLCDFQSRRTYALRLHTKNIHSNVKQKTCEFCGELRKDLKKHLERTKCGQGINVEERKDIECEQCGKKFTTTDSLKKHTKAIHMNVKNMQCNYCDYKTYSGYNLKLHITKMHEGKDTIEKVTCQSCQKIVTNLPYHNKIYHLGQNNTFE